MSDEKKPPPGHVFLVPRLAFTVVGPHGSVEAEQVGQPWNGMRELTVRPSSSGSGGVIIIDDQRGPTECALPDLFAVERTPCSVLRLSPDLIGRLFGTTSQRDQAEGGGDG